jgi:hypothetical protein
VTAGRLVRLYPRAWRERYGEELDATVGDRELTLQETLDLVFGAIDAWLSREVRQATGVESAGPNGGGAMTLRAMLACERTGWRASKRDSLIGAAVMVGASALFAVLGTVAGRSGWEAARDFLLAISFPASVTLSMPFWLMKGQSWRAQVAIVGVTLAILVAIGYAAVALDN